MKKCVHYWQLVQSNNVRQMIPSNSYEYKSRLSIQKTLLKYKWFYLYNKHSTKNLDLTCPDILIKKSERLKRIIVAWNLKLGSLKHCNLKYKETQFQLLVSKPRLNESVPSSNRHFTAARKEVIEIKLFFYTSQSCLKDPFHRFIRTNCVCMEGLSIQCRRM